MKQQSPKTKPYYVPTNIQRLFTYPIIGLYLVQTGFVVFSTLSQSYGGSDYGPQLGYLVIYNLIPILIFVLAYAINPRQLGRLAKTFESLLITIAAYIVETLVSLVLPMLLINSGGFSSNYNLYQYSFSGFFLALYIITLVVLRKKRLWA